MSDTKFGGNDRSGRCDMNALAKRNNAKRKTVTIRCNGKVIQRYSGYMEAGK